jgi:hypothetical protein
LSSKLAAPKFSEFLKDFGKKDPNFAQMVHDKLAELVKLAKEVTVLFETFNCRMSHYLDFPELHIIYFVVKLIRVLCTFSHKSMKSYIVLIAITFKLAYTNLKYYFGSFQSKQKSRSYSFDCMNREKRQFVHEYSDHFGVTTESFDCEPKRNVVATALKDKSWLPSQSIIEVVQNARKALGPVTLTSKSGSFFG